MLLPASDIISVLASSAPTTPGAAVDAALAASGVTAPQPGQISSTQLFTQLLQGTLLTGISTGALPDAVSADGGAAATQSSGEASGDGQGQGDGQQQAGVLAWLFPVAALAAPPAEPVAPVAPPPVDDVTLTPATAIQVDFSEIPLVQAPVPPAAPTPAAPLVDAAVADAVQAPVVSEQAAPAKPRDLLQELLAHIKSVPAESSPEKALQKIQEMLSASTDVDVEVLLQKILASATTAQQPKPLQAIQVAEKVAAEAPVQALAVLPAVKAAVTETSPVRQTPGTPAVVQAQDADTSAPVPAVQPVPRDLTDSLENSGESTEPAEPKLAKAHDAFKPVAAASDKPASQVTDALLRQVIQVLSTQPQATSIPADVAGDQGGTLSFSASNGPDLSAIAGALADRLSQLETSRAVTEHFRPAHHAANVAEQVAVKITQGVRDGASLIQIRLEPQDLGRVDVRLDVAADGKTSITVIASNRDSLESLQAGSRQLEKALTDAGLKTDSGSLSFSYRGDSQNQQNFAGQLPQLGQYRSPAEEEAVELVQEVTLTYRPEHNRELDIKV